MLTSNSWKNKVLISNLEMEKKLLEMEEVYKKQKEEADQLFEQQRRF